MNVRLVDVAQRAGVSVATVSRVLNDKPGVNQKTRRAVLTALDVLGYDRPSRLRARGAGLVGLIVPELVNPYFPRFAQSVEAALARAGYTPVLCTQSLGGVHEDEYVATLLDHGVSGIIFVSGIHAIAGGDSARYQRLTSLGLPIVLVNGPLPDVAATFISNDDNRTMDLAVAHLANMGHVRIGFATGQRRYTPVLRRIDAFGAAMRAHVEPYATDAELEPWVECTYFTVEGGVLAARQLLEAGATAIVCGSDLMALGAVRAARQVGLRVPADVSVVGSDDSAVMEFTDPPLTTVRQPAEEMAAAAVDHLLDQIRGGQPPRTEILFEPSLVVRSSSGRLRVPESTGGRPPAPEA